jgi:hypothetical protein
MTINSCSRCQSPCASTDLHCDAARQMTRRSKSTWRWIAEESDSSMNGIGYNIYGYMISDHMLYIFIHIHVIYIYMCVCVWIVYKYI